MALTWQERTRDLLLMLNIELSPEQSDVFYPECRLRVIGGGEGAGKSFLGALYGVCRTISAFHERGATNQLVWIIGQDFEDARKEADYVLEFAESLRVLDRGASTISSHKDQKVAVRLSLDGIPLAAFETISAGDVTKIGREQPDGIIGAEVTRWKDVEAWRRAKGRLMRKYPSAWGIFSGSFETSLGWFPEVFELGRGPNMEGLMSFELPTWGNRVLYPGGWDNEAIQMLYQTENEIRFWERYGGRPQKPRDALFPEFKNLLHVSELAYLDTSLPVYLFVDPGDKVYCVLFVQFSGSEVHIIDEIYVSRWTHEQIIMETSMRTAWQYRAGHGHIMDYAAIVQHHGGQKSASEAWYDDTGISFEGAKRGVDDQVERLRSVMSISPTTMRPYLLVNPRCSGFISEMGGGNSPVENGGVWRIIHGKPEADHNHACNALAYGLLWHLGAKRPAALQTMAAASYLEGKSTGVSSYLQRGLNEPL